MIFVPKKQDANLAILADGTLYHTQLRKAHCIPKNIFLVGATSRVDQFKSHFSEIIFEHNNPARLEFYTVAGKYAGVEMAVMSIGIGVSAIDIALNELHILFEYDHLRGIWSDEPAKVNIIRVGTCGTSLPSISLGALAISEHAIGLDNLGAFYPVKKATKDNDKINEELTKRIEKKFLETIIGKINPLSYAAPASSKVVDALLRVLCFSKESNENWRTGITTASPGFFGPEGRKVGRIETSFSKEEFMSVIKDFKVSNRLIINHEMETSILFRLANQILDYRAGAICVVVDNLSNDVFIDDESADKKMHECIDVSLEAMTHLAND